MIFTIHINVDRYHHLPHQQAFHWPSHACYFSSTWNICQHPPLFSLLCLFGIIHQPRLTTSSTSPYWSTLIGYPSFLLASSLLVDHVSLVITHVGPWQVSLVSYHAPLHLIKSTSHLCLYSFSYIPISLFTGWHSDDFMPSNSNFYVYEATSFYIYIPVTPCAQL